MVTPAQNLTPEERAVVNAALTRWWNDSTEQRIDMVERLQTMNGIAARVTSELRNDQRLRG